MNPITDNSTVAQAREYVAERLEEGVTCPACHRHAQRYRRKINAGMARAMVLLYREHMRGHEWVMLRSVLLRERTHTGDYAYLVHWGLLEAADERLEDGNSAGFWRLTESGRAFVAHGLKVPKYVHLYNGQLQTVSGPQIGIAECIGDTFNLRELIERAA